MRDGTTKTTKAVDKLAKQGVEKLTTKSASWQQKVNNLKEKAK